jgi:D-tyrosyl-tRNA(Tyr) deacylase
MDIGGEVLAVSQFTLYGIMKGNKPDFHGAMGAEQAKDLFDHYVNSLKKKYSPERIQTGKFQHLMEVGSIINGPVTIQYEKSAEEKPEKKERPEKPGKKVEEVRKEG